MPSHISHALLVEELISRGLPGGQFVPAPPPTLPIAPILYLAAQGPDPFLHNHRRRPRGFRYGALFHRKGNEEFLGSLAQTVRADPGASERGWLAAWALGHISHVWMDRVLHPYINWSAGWRGVPDVHPDRPAMHAFLERLIDVKLLRHLRDCDVASWDFASRLPPASTELRRLSRTLTGAIRKSLVSAMDDDRLWRRLANAWADAYGLYRHTSRPDERYLSEGVRSERAGRLKARWLSIVHPPEALITVDVLNLERRSWSHPCGDSDGTTDNLESNETVIDLFERALAATEVSWRAWLDAAGLASSPPVDVTARPATTIVGHENLNDGRTGDPPCHRVKADPLPLVELFNSIKDHYA